MTETTDDTFSMCVTPDHFAEHLQVLSQLAHPTDLHKLVSGVRKGHIPRRAVALTFDDGYADVLYHAKPALETYQIPATVFVVPGYLGREFWWDELARLLLFGELPPERSRPAVGKEINQWITGVSSGQANDPNDTQLRLSILNVLYERFRYLSFAERERLLTQLRTAIFDGNHRTQTHRALTPEEVVQLSSNGLITIGAHTMTHADLPKLPEDLQISEIWQSKTDLEKLLGIPVHGFAFPHSSYSQHVERVVRQAGFVYACAGLNDITWPRSNLFQLPRFWIPDWNGDRFKRWLRRWLT